MLTVKNKNKRAFFKKLLRARYNLVNSTKIFKLKKKKWDRFKFFARIKLRFFRRYRYHDQAKMHVNKFSSFGNSYKKRFRNHLVKSKGIQLMYGGFKKRSFKKIITSKHEKKFLKRFRGKTFCHQNDNIITLLRFETRVDTVLVRSYFCHTLRQSRQFIKHGHINVNGVRVRLPSHRMLYGDVLSISLDSKIKNIVRKNIVNASFWPLPPLFLKINFRTLNIVNVSKSLGTEKLFLRYNLRIETVKSGARFM